MDRVRVGLPRSRGAPLRGWPASNRGPHPTPLPRRGGEGERSAPGGAGDEGERRPLARAGRVRRAIERGEEFLFRELPRVRRDDPMLIYNVWTHGYGIQALVRMHGRLPDDQPRRARIEGLIRAQYDRLTRYESAEGGWGYY